MWIFLNNAFLSIVKPSRFDKGIDPKKLLKVRARCEGDIENVFGKVKIHKTLRADYRFRAFIDRDIVALEIARSVRNIGYENFKDSIPKDRHPYHVALLKVWSTMFCLQNDMENKWATSGNRSFVPQSAIGRKK